MLTVNFLRKIQVKNLTDKRSFTSFRPRFASKCDRQSSDLTQDFSNLYSELTQGISHQL